MNLPLASAVLAGACVVVTAGRIDAGCNVPSNESCDGAIVFNTASLPYVEEGIGGCANDVTDKPYWDIFYRYDCTVSGSHTFGMCDSERDTYIRIYTDGCGWADGDEFAVADDNCPGSPPNADPLLTVSLEAGMSYWIELGTWRPDLPWGEPNLPYRFTAVVCPADLDVDGEVGIDDFLFLLASWGGPDGDVDGDGDTDIDDFLFLLASWGPCA